MIEAQPERLGAMLRAAAGAILLVAFYEPWARVRDAAASPASEPVSGWGLGVLTQGAGWIAVTGALVSAVVLLVTRRLESWAALVVLTCLGIAASTQSAEANVGLVTCGALLGAYALGKLTATSSDASARERAGLDAACGAACAIALVMGAGWAGVGNELLDGAALSARVHRVALDGPEVLRGFRMSVAHTPGLCDGLITAATGGSLIGLGLLLPRARYVAALLLSLLLAVIAATGAADVAIGALAFALLAFASRAARARHSGTPEAPGEAAPDASGPQPQPQPPAPGPWTRLASLPLTRQTLVVQAALMGTYLLISHGVTDVYPFSTFDVYAAAAAPAARILVVDDNGVTNEVTAYDRWSCTPSVDPRAALPFGYGEGHSLSHLERAHAAHIADHQGTGDERVTIVRRVYRVATESHELTSADTSVIRCLARRIP